jgi:outer membrane protein assembly factor BamA
VYQRASVEVATPVLDMRYVRANYQHQYWIPFGGGYALMLNGDVGYAHGYDGKELPFYKNFYAGGIGSVRGYEQSTLGPRYTDSSGFVRSLGGNRRMVGNAEYYFPMPGSQKDKSMRLSLFADAGYVWGRTTRSGLPICVTVPAWRSPGVLPSAPSSSVLVRRSRRKRAIVRRNSSSSWVRFSDRDRTVLQADGGLSEGYWHFHAGSSAAGQRLHRRP